MVFSNPPESSFSEFNKIEKLSMVALYSLVMQNRHGVIPSTVLPRFVEFKLAKIYTWDVGAGDEVIPFVKLTPEGLETANTAYRTISKDPGGKRLLDDDIFSVKDKWPNVKFLMSHQRFKKELQRSRLDILRVDYDMGFPIS